MQVWLKKKGLASANKKANRIAAEGVIETYIHAGANLGVLIEVNCETDFVAKGNTFKELAENLAMQVLLFWSVSSVALCHARPRASLPIHNFEALGFVLSFVQI
jgi:translation elongation factor EF-Ts